MNGTYEFSYGPITIQPVFMDRIDATSTYLNLIEVVYASRKPIQMIDFLNTIR